jgi:hypothetical protein
VVTVRDLLFYTYPALDSNIQRSSDQRSHPVAASKKNDLHHPGIVYSILVVRFQNLSDVVTVRDLLRRREHMSLTTLIATTDHGGALLEETSRENWLN